MIDMLLDSPQGWSRTVKSRIETLIQNTGMETLFEKTHKFLRRLQ